MKTNKKQSGKRKGSVLIVTLILGTAIALALGSYIAVTVNAVGLSHRSFHANSSLNLAEAGLEEAIFALNNKDWTGWTTHSSGSDNKFRTIGPVTLGSGATGNIAVLVKGTSASQPVIVAQGETIASSGPSIVKQLECKVQRRSHWGTGVVAKENVKFSGGNVYVDSYSSCDPLYSTGGMYDPAKKRDRGSVASARIVSEVGVDIGNSDVWGFVATSGADVDVGPNGTVKGEDTPTGVKKDPNRITKDFAHNFEPEKTPSVTGTETTILGDDVIVGSSNRDTPTRVTVANLVNSSGETILVQGHVELIVLNSVDIKGSIDILYDPTESPATVSSLTMYVEGDVFVGGNGIANESKVPADFILYGTNDIAGGQQIKLHGNGAMYAAIFAPNADIELKGGGSGGEMWGSVVGNSIKITGNYNFHYDECLEDETDGKPFAVATWRELHAAGDRVALY